jgi:hypothetical protein
MLELSTVNGRKVRTFPRLAEIAPGSSPSLSTSTLLQRDTMSSSIFSFNPCDRKTVLHLWTSTTFHPCASSRKGVTSVKKTGAMSAAAHMHAQEAGKY